MRPALTAGSASLDRVAAGTAIDAGGLVPDLDPVNSWVQRVHEVDPNVPVAVRKDRHCRQVFAVWLRGK